MHIHNLILTHPARKALLTLLYTKVDSEEPSNLLIETQ